MGSMFIQVVQGRTANEAGLRERFADWNERLAAGAAGWLGATAGATADGEFIAVVRFEDEAAARRNSDRPEQGEWWRGTEALFAGPVTFHDYANTDLMMGGGSNDAGFVQIIQGRYGGAGSPAIPEEEAADLAELRPEVLGATMGWDESGHLTQTVYFTNEAAARAGEAAMAANPDALGWIRAWLADVDDLSYLDLANPWFS